MYGFYAYKGKSYPMTEIEIQKISSKKSNDDHLFVKCSKCKTYMIFERGDTGMIDGRYVCDKCGDTVDEYEVYDILGEENDFIEEEMDIAKRQYYESDQSLYDICRGDW